MQLFPLVGGIPRKTPRPMFIFSSGAKVTFGRLERYEDCLSYQGSQIPLLCFDELTHFSEDVFWYMFSRNRSDSGISGYIRATTNPDPDSWVRKFIDWWINEEGYAIPERSGVIRWFIRVNGEIIWGDSKESLLSSQLEDGARRILKFKSINHFPEKGEVDVIYKDKSNGFYYKWLGDEYKELITPKSVTFIASSLFDNKILMKNDPSYYASLKALPLVEQERLLGGNWNIRASAGLFFKRSQIEPDGWLEQVPDDVVQWVRGWDLAATDESEGGEPAYTAGVLIGKRKNGKFVIADATNVRLSASKVRNHILSTARMDKARYKKIKIRIPLDPGQAGKEQNESYIKMLAGFSVVSERETGSKETRAEPLAAQWQVGNVQIVLGDWNEMFLNQLEAFPEGKFKDLVDSAAGAFNELCRMNTYSIPPVNAGNATRTNPWDI